MKKILLSVTCVLCAVAFSLSTAFAGEDDPNPIFDAGAEVSCKCSWANKQCLANNGGSACGGGENFSCQSLNSNCGGTNQ